MAKRPPLEIRKPQKSPSPNVDAFVNKGGDHAPDSGKGQKGILTRADGRITRRMTMYVEPDLARRVQLYCVQQGREISDVAAEALEAFIR